MPTKVLVAYGTTNGSTARIAETIAEVLRKGGVPAEAVPAHSVTDVESYDAVVVGGGLYGGAGTRTPAASSVGTAVCSPGVRCGSSAAVRSTPRPRRRTSRPFPAYVGP